MGDGLSSEQESHQDMELKEHGRPKPGSWARTAGEVEILRRWSGGPACSLQDRVHPKAQNIHWKQGYHPSLRQHHSGSFSCSRRGKSTLAKATEWPAQSAFAHGPEPDIGHRTLTLEHKADSGPSNLTTEATLAGQPRLTPSARRPQHLSLCP
jgi:hypothetical protein